MDRSRENFFGKIQSIYNRKCAPTTMQAFACAREKPLAQEQWKTMEKTMRKTTMEPLPASSRAARSCRDPTKTIARRREAPGADFHH
jgi:hypothetical protein